MNGVHDLGGMHGLGAIEIERDEPVFHHEWERRTFAMTMAFLGGGNCVLDELRHAIERMAPGHYLSSSYYEHWLASIETLIDEKGIVSTAELAARKAEIAAEAG